MQGFLSLRFCIYLFCCLSSRNLNRFSSCWPDIFQFVIVNLHLSVFCELQDVHCKIVRLKNPLVLRSIKNTSHWLLLLSYLCLLIMNKYPSITNYRVTIHHYNIYIYIYVYIYIYINTCLDTHISYIIISGLCVK